MNPGFLNFILVLFLQNQSFVYFLLLAWLVLHPVAHIHTMVTCELRRNLYLIVIDICRSFKNAMILAPVTFQVRINKPMCKTPHDVLCLKKAMFQNGGSFQVFFSERLCFDLEIGKPN